MSAFKRSIGVGSKVYQIGLRGGLTDDKDYNFALENGAHMITIDDIKQQGVDAVIKEFANLENQNIYVSLDIDAVDPAYAPGTGFPEVGGMTSHEIIQLVRGLKGLQIVGCDLVEVLPAHDVGHITSLLASHLIFEFLSVYACQKEGR